MKRFLLFLLGLLIVFAVTFLWWKDATSPVDSQDTTLVNFTIPKGQTIKEIAANLKKDGLIKDRIAFFTYVRFSGLGQKIQAGNFRLSKSMNTKEIANGLTHGTNDVRVTIIEGWRVEETALELAKSLSIPEGEFLKYAKEGYMFPDTYYIPKDATAASVVDIIFKNFRSQVTQNIIEKGKTEGLNLDEMITLASILEREVKEEKDRPIVAGIFLKRLKGGWPLQADATVQYALGYSPEEKTWWKKNLTVEDLEINSLYNTYKHVGLPLGPIASPGLSSINAVVSPVDTDYWYYLSDNKGVIHFSKTQDEQDRKVEKYLH